MPRTARAAGAALTVRLGVTPLLMEHALPHFTPGGLGFAFGLALMAVSLLLLY